MFRRIEKEKQQQQHMKIARQCCKTAFVTPAQIWTNCMHKIFVFTGHKMS